MLGFAFLASGSETLSQETSGNTTTLSSITVEDSTCEIITLDTPTIDVKEESSRTTQKNQVDVYAKIVTDTSISLDNTVEAAFSYLQDAEQVYQQSAPGNLSVSIIKYQTYGENRTKLIVGKDQGETYLIQEFSFFTDVDDDFMDYTKAALSEFENYFNLNLNIISS